MESLLLAAFLAAAPASDAAPAPLDLRCFGLMAEMADHEDPRIRAAGRIAAQYFLGRIDASSSAFDSVAAIAPASDAERERLLHDCGEALQAGGRDFTTIGEALAPPRQPTA
jgi:hypothetical protein